MLTLARLAAAITDVKRDWTFDVIDRPSEKKTMLLRPGIAFIDETMASSAFAVE